MKPGEAESWLRAKLGRKKLDITWDHPDNLIHKFTVSGIGRNSGSQELTMSWDGTATGVNQKGSSIINIPPAGEFSIIDIIMSAGENQKIDIIFSDPVEAAQEIEGLIQFTPSTQTTVSINSNIISIFPSNRLQGTVSVNVESSLKSNKGLTLKSSFLRQLNFTAVPPGLLAEGNGVILPSSKNLIFPFKAANLKAVDLRIVRIFDNNLPYFLQENNLNGSYSIKRFGRPVFSGRVDLVNSSGKNTGTWNLYTIDLADYIDVEPGVLYKVSLGMRRSYSLYPCSETGEVSKYEEELQQSEEQSREVLG